MQHKTAVVAAVFLTLALSTTLVAQAEYPVSPEPVFDTLPFSVSAALSDGRDFLVGGSAGTLRMRADGALIDEIPLTANSWEPGSSLFAAGKYVFFAVTAEAMTMSRIDAATGAIERLGVVLDHPSAARYVFVSNGKTILAVATDHYHIFDADGELIERDVPLPLLDPAARSIALPLAASNGSTYLLAWVDTAGYRQLVDLPLDANGRATGPVRPIRAILRENARLASDGRDYLLVAYDVVWTGQRIAGDGTPGERIPIDNAPSTSLPALVWGGESYLLLYKGSAMRLDRNGRPLDPLPVSNALIDTSAVVAADSRRMISSNAIIDTRSLQTVVPAFPPVRRVRSQFSPRIAAGSTNLLVNWSENAPRTALMSLDGAVIAYPDLAGAGIAHYEFLFDGTNYLGYSATPTSLALARVAPDGTVLARTVIPEARNGLAVWSNGAATLLVLSNFFGLRAILLDRDLRVQWDAQVVWLPNIISSFPGSIAWNGREWMIAFVDAVPPFGQFALNPLRVRTVRLAAAGYALDPQPQIIGDATYNYLPMPRSTWDGGDFVVFWNQRDGVRARRVRSDGSLRDDVLLAPNARLADLVWDGERYTMLLDVPLAIGRSELRLGTTDVTLRLPPLANSTILPALPPGARLAVTPGGRTFLAYSRLVAELPYAGAARVFVREVPRRR